MCDISKFNMFMKSVKQLSFLSGISGVVLTIPGQATKNILTCSALGGHAKPKHVMITSTLKDCKMLQAHALWLVAALFATSSLFAQTATPAANDTPRLATGHPCTFWDNRDVAACKVSITTDPGLRSAFNELQAWGNKRVSEPLNVPNSKLEADGAWSFPAFKRGYQDAAGKWNWEWDFNGALQQRTADISNLGMPLCSLQ
jgi:hypothetical protein